MALFRTPETNSPSERNSRVVAACFRPDSVPRPSHVFSVFVQPVCPSAFFSSFFGFSPVKSSAVRGHAEWRESRRQRQLFVLRVPGSGALFKPRATRAPVPPEAPGVLPGDDGR